MTLAPQDLYHSGYLVEDIEQCLQRFATLGYTRWTPPKNHALTIRVGDELSVARFRYVYSADGPHHLELIEPLAPGYLRPDGPISFHHLGFWVDDLPTASASAEAAGLAPECTFLAEDGSAKVAYHRDAAGLRYELVPRAHRAVMEQRWATARSAGDEG